MNKIEIEFKLTSSPINKRIMLYRILRFLHFVNISMENNIRLSLASISLDLTQTGKRLARDLGLIRTCI